MVLIRKDAATLDCKLPDGFEELGTYNLISFKSHKDKLSTFTLEELVGHYVNLRKQVSPSMDDRDLLPADDFRLFAVSARFPSNLADDDVELEAVQPGVFRVKALSRWIGVVVVSQLPMAEHNAMLHLFSAKGSLLEYGAKHYRVKSNETSTLLFDLFERYQAEAEAMPDALEEFTRQTIDRILKNLPVEKRVEVIKELPAEKRLEGMSVDEVLAAMAPEMREALKQRLKDDPDPKP